MQEFTEKELKDLAGAGASQLDLSNLVVAVKKLKNEVEANFNVLLTESQKLSAKTSGFDSKINGFDNEIKSIPSLKLNQSSIQEAQRKTETQIESIKSGFQLEITGFKSSVSDSKRLIDRLNTTLESESQKLKNAIDRQNNSERDISTLKLNIQENLSAQRENKEQLDKCVSNLRQEAQRINEVIQVQKQIDRKLSELEIKLSSTLQKLNETKDTQDNHYEELQRFTKETITHFNTIERQYETLANNLKEETQKSNQRIDTTLAQIKLQDQTIKELDAKNIQFHNELLLAQKKNATLIKIVLGILIPVTCVSIFFLISFFNH